MRRILAPILLLTFLFPAIAQGQSLDEWIGKGKGLLGKGKGYLCETTGVGCPESVDSDDLVKRDGLYYEKFSTVPFTGKVSSKLFQRSYKNGKRHGAEIHYWSSGQLLSTTNWKDDKKHGSSVKYYENGQLRFKSIYNDGKEEGTSVGYYKNGQLSFKGTYKDGRRDGSWVTHHQNGQVESRGKYLAVIYPNGGRHGAWVYYHSNGRLKSKGNFKNGKKEGYWLSLNEDGSTRWEYRGTYKNGVKVSD